MIVGQYILISAAATAIEKKIVVSIPLQQSLIQLSTFVKHLK
jgi:hypothetical protein